MRLRSGLLSLPISIMKLVNQYYTATFSDGIVYVQYNDYLYISMEDARVIVEDRVRFFGDLKFPVLIRNAKIKGIDKDARDYLFDTQKGLKNVTAMGFVELNKVDRIMLKIIFHQHTPGIPHQAFDNETDAVAWLAQYR